VYSGAHSVLIATSHIAGDSADRLRGILAAILPGAQTSNAPGQAAQQPAGQPQPPQGQQPSGSQQQQQPGQLAAAPSDMQDTAAQLRLRFQPQGQGQQAQQPQQQQQPQQRVDSQVCSAAAAVPQTVLCEYTTRMAGWLYAQARGVLAARITACRSGWCPLAELRNAPTLSVVVVPAGDGRRGRPDSAGPGAPAAVGPPPRGAILRRVSGTHNTSMRSRVDR